MFDFVVSFSKFTSRGHGSLTPSHANEAMEFRPEENVDAHSCTCIVETFDKLLYYGVSAIFDNLPISIRRSLVKFRFKSVPFRRFSI